MAGQPRVPGLLDFDLHDLAITFEAVGPAPTTSVPVGTAFNLQATFTGSGATWRNAMKGLPATYTVQFFAEGMGVAAADIDLGAVGPLPLDGRDTYQVILAHGGIPVAGVYRLTCLVTFAAPWNHVVGFYEGPLLLQIY